MKNSKRKLVAILDEMVDRTDLADKNYLQILARVRDAVEHVFYDQGGIPMGSESVKL